MSSVKREIWRFYILYQISFRKPDFMRIEHRFKPFYIDSILTSVFVLLGMILGKNGLGVLHPHLLGVGLEVIVALSVAAILFEGVLNLSLRKLGRVSRSLRNLVTVVLIDTDADACQKADAENLPVFQSSGLDRSASEEAGIESMGTSIALTNNGGVNLVLAQRAIEEFAPPSVLAAFPRQVQNSSTGKIDRALLQNLSLKTWNQYIDDGQYKLGKTLLQKTAELGIKQAHLQALMRSGELLPLLLKRDKSLYVVTATDEWQPKDELIYLLYDPRPKLLKRLSKGVPSLRSTLEQLPEVENIPIATPVSLSDLKAV